MKTSDEILNKKIQQLQKELEEKQAQIDKYQQTLTESNTRIKNVLKDLEASISVMRSIHHNLLPSHLPKIPHFEFSYKFTPTRQGISGDFFDVINLENPLQFGIILSNCKSYSATSLFLSTFLKCSRSLKKSQEPSKFLKLLSKELAEHCSKKDEISVFFGVVNRKDFSLTYCSAGQVLSYLKPFDANFEELKPCAPSLCEDHADLLKNSKKELQPKDYLVLSSPGLVNKENSEGKIFGSQGILDSIPNKADKSVLEIRQSILIASEKFAQGKIQKKDETLLIMEVKDRILKLAKNRLI